MRGRPVCLAAGGAAGSPWCSAGPGLRRGRRGGAAGAAVGGTERAGPGRAGGGREESRLGGQLCKHPQLRKHPQLCKHPQAFAPVSSWVPGSGRSRRGSGEGRRVRGPELSWWGLGRAGRAGRSGRMSPPQLSAEPRVCLCPGCGLNRRVRLRGLWGWGGGNSPAGPAVGAAFVPGEGRVVRRIFPAPAARTR